MGGAAVRFIANNPLQRHPARTAKEKAAAMLMLRHPAVFLAALLVSWPSLASPELARSKNCVACHHAERRMIGPPYNAIAQRYANDAAAVRTLSERIVAGGGGNWGPMAMPPQANISPEEAETLARWILSQQ
jgi:cytochrome c